MYQACSEVIATNPLLAPAAHLHRGLVSLAGDGDIRVAVEDFRAAVASHDGPVVYKATGQLLQMGRTLAVHEDPHRRAFAPMRERAVFGLRGGIKSHYTAEIREWARMSAGLLFTAHPYAILAWLHSRPGHTLALPSLERFYIAAAEFGYADPMPQVRQLLGVAVAPVQSRTEIT